MRSQLKWRSQLYKPRKRKFKLKNNLFKSKKKRLHQLLRRSRLKPNQKQKSSQLKKRLRLRSLSKLKSRKKFRLRFKLRNQPKRKRSCRRLSRYQLIPLEAMNLQDSRLSSKNKNPRWSQ